MYLFLIPLILGFALNIASAFTTAFSNKFGIRWGTAITAVLRNFLGIPLWAFGLVLAFGEKSPSLFPSTLLNVIVGWIAIAGGMILIFAAMFSVRTKSAAPSINDRLVEQGVYAHIRHPVYAGVCLEIVGLFLVNPTQIFGAATLLGIVWLAAQAKAEEYDLIQRAPWYKEYMKRVPGFFPGSKR